MVAPTIFPKLFFFHMLSCCIVDFQKFLWQLGSLTRKIILVFEPKFGGRHCAKYGRQINLLTISNAAFHINIACWRFFKTWKFKFGHKMESVRKSDNELLMTVKSFRSFSIKTSADCFYWVEYHFKGFRPLFSFQIRKSLRKTANETFCSPFDWRFHCRLPKFEATEINGFHHSILIQAKTNRVYSACGLFEEFGLH